MRPTRLVFLLVCLTAMTASRGAFAQTSRWPEGAWVRGQQIVVQFTGVLRAPPSLQRTKEEARRRAMEVIKRVTEGEPFDSLVREFSDDPAAARNGGDLGLVAPGALAPELEQALLELKDGEVTRVPVQTTFGFHIIRRLPSEPRLVIRHILVAYAGAMRATADIKRTRDEAKARATEIAGKLADGADFEELARTMSDDKATAASGGLLGDVQTGMAIPAIQSAASALDPGEVSPVIETPFGFQILRRDKVP